MPKDVVLGLDLGTSGVRVLAVDFSGNIVAESNESYPLLTPKPGWTEQRPSDWLAASLRALRDIVDGLEPNSIKALGLSGQMHGMVALDKSRNVIRPAILWNDQRTQKAIEEIDKVIPKKEMIAKTGNPAITGFQLSKIIWLRQNEPDNYSKLAHVLLPKDYLAFALTGEMNSEATDASGTNIFNIKTKTWDDDIAEALGLEQSIFPNIVNSHEISGHLSKEMALKSNLPKGLAVIAGAGDNAAAATGLGLSSKNLTRGALSLGTSGVIFAPLESPTPDPKGRVHLFCHADASYNLLGVTLSAAGSYEWFQKTFAGNYSFAQLDNLAATSQIGSNGVTFKPYLAGERSPYLDPNLRASFSGLSLANTLADMTRSVLEAVAFSLRDTLEVITKLTTVNEFLLTGGGSKSELWRQILADVLQRKLLLPKFNQGAAYGAALLALQGSGVVVQASTAAQVEIAKVIAPKDSSTYEPSYEKYKSLNF